LDENSVKKENKSLAEFRRQEEGKPVESHNQKEEEDDLIKQNLFSLEYNNSLK
jgi:hypothetical protein